MAKPKPILKQVKPSKDDPIIAPFSPFVTGSNAYGKPHDDSDVDLVLPPLPVSVTELLRINSDLGTYPIRYGKLNLILTNTQEQFNVWKEGTDILSARTSPVNNKEATEFFTELCAKRGIPKSFRDSGKPQ